MADVQLGARALDALLGSWRGSGPVYGALADRIRLLVLDGRVPADTGLPAERDLAARLGISRTTITAAYRELRASGYLRSIRGSGSVTTLPGSLPALVAVPEYGILDFTRASLPAIEGLADAARHAVDELPRHLAGGGFDAVGTAGLRAAIADRYRARGLPTAPEQIMVTLGAQHAIALLARVLLGRGDRALIEMPTYPHAYEALRAAGARLVPVSVSADAGSSGGGDGGAGADGGAGGGGAGDGESAGAGWDETALLQALRRTNPTLGYLMPDFHNPTGQSMSVALRERVLAAAARQGTILIADETTAELDIDRGGTFPPFAAFGDAISIGSVGKTLWGGIRVGWIRAERPLIHKLVAARTANDLGTPVLEQLIVTRLLGDMDAILERRRDQLRTSRDHLRSLLERRFPHWRVPDVHGGVTAWVNLGSPVSSRLALAARNHGLLITAGPRFGIDGAFERFLRVPIGYSRHETERAVDSLELAWRSLPRHPLPDTAYLSDVV